MSNQDPSPSAAPTISPERRAVYLGRRAQDLALLNAAIQEKDFGTIGSIAHKIKGSARLFGFNNLETLMLEIEAACEMADLPAVEKAAQTFSTILADA